MERRRLSFDEIALRMQMVIDAKNRGEPEEASRVWKELNLPSVDALIEDLAHSEGPDDE